MLFEIPAGRARARAVPRFRSTPALRPTASPAVDKGVRLSDTQRNPNLQFPDENAPCNFMAHFPRLRPRAKTPPPPLTPLVRPRRTRAPLGQPLPHSVQTGHPAPLAQNPATATHRRPLR